MSRQFNILVADELHPDALRLLRNAGKVTVQPNLSTAELQKQIGAYEALVVGPQTRVTHDIIEEGLNLRAIGCVSPRLDNIDVTAARTMGIPVCNSPSGNSVAIAEHTMALMLRLAMRQLSAAGYEGGLAGKTLGIIGFGRIGREVARRALAFSMHVIANQPRLTPELALDDVEPTDLLELLQTADFVTLHVPFKAETDALIGARELAMMQPHAYLVNTGHTDLVDDVALLDALNQGQIAGAALSQLPPGVPPTEAGEQVRAHPRVVVVPHVTRIIGSRRRDGAVAVARQVLERLREKRPSETLSLDIVPVEQVSPHEQIDDKRVARLMERLKDEARLINPPIVTHWNEQFIILDGATRFTALRRLGYPHLIVQIVDAHRDDFELHTWYHVISDPRPAAELFTGLASIDGLQLLPQPVDAAQNALHDPLALCYFLDRQGKATLAKAIAPEARLHVMNELVARYTEWGDVERTLLTDLDRLRGQFPQMSAVAVFPQFKPETVFDTASRGALLPAGLTRFVIPGRVLRLNAELEKLRSDEPLPAKRAWFNEFLAQKLSRSRLRYYQEPVILLDE